MPQPKRVQPDTGVYGSSKPLSCIAALVGQHNVLGAGNALYDLKGEVFSEKSNPRLLNFPTSPLAFYYVRPYLIAEDELRHRLQDQRLQRLLLYAEDTKNMFGFRCPFRLKLR